MTRPYHFSQHHFVAEWNYFSIYNDVGCLVGQLVELTAIFTLIRLYHGGQSTNQSFQVCQYQPNYSKSDLLTLPLFTRASCQKQLDQIKRNVEHQLSQRRIAAPSGVRLLTQLILVGLKVMYFFTQNFFTQTTQQLHQHFCQVTGYKQDIIQYSKVRL